MPRPAAAQRPTTGECNRALPGIGVYIVRCPPELRRRPCHVPFLLVQGQARCSPRRGRALTHACTRIRRGVLDEWRAISSYPPRAPHGSAPTAPLLQAATSTWAVACGGCLVSRISSYLVSMCRLSSKTESSSRLLSCGGSAADDPQQNAGSAAGHTRNACHVLSRRVSTVV